MTKKEIYSLSKTYVSKIKLKNLKFKKMNSKLLTTSTTFFAAYFIHGLTIVGAEEGIFDWVWLGLGLNADFLVPILAHLETTNTYFCSCVAGLVALTWTVIKLTCFLQY